MTIVTVWDMGKIFALIDPVDFQVATVLLRNEPGRQRFGKRNVRARTSHEPTNVPGACKIAQRIRVSGGEHRVIISKHGFKPWKICLTSIQISLEEHGPLRQRSVSIGALASGRSQ